MATKNSPATPAPQPAGDAPVVLHGPALAAAARAWIARLDGSKKDRLAQLVAAAIQPRTTFAQVTGKFWPQSEGETTAAYSKRLTNAFSTLRSELNQAAAGTPPGLPDLRLRIEADTKKRSPLDQREFWFTGPDPSRAAALGTAYASTSGTPDRVQSLGYEVTAEGRIKVNLFVSYAHADNLLAVCLLKRLKPLLQTRRFAVTLWIDHEIPPGLGWESEIRAALEKSHLGLFLFSPAALVSDFIIHTELAHYLPSKENPTPKPLVTVGLKKFDFAENGPPAVRRLQTFVERDDERRPQFYSQLGETARDEFAFHLFEALLQRLDGLFPENPDTLAPAPAPGEKPSAAALAVHLAAVAAEAGEVAEEALHLSHSASHLQEHASRTRTEAEDIARLAKQAEGNFIIDAFGETADGLHSQLSHSPGAPAPRSGAVPAVEAIVQWARDPASPAYFALLGELGIGKTTTLRQATQRLLDIHKNDSASPIPIYIDLKDAAREGERHLVPRLHDLLQASLDRSSDTADAVALTPAQLIDLVQTGRAVVFFDGLDEKIVHLSPAQSRDFLRELFRMLPPSLVKKQAAAPPPAPGVPAHGRWLVSCRSHYFRDVAAQMSYLLAEDRERLQASDYRTMVLLPFTEEQIKTYLQGVLGSPKRAERAFSLIQEIHNLKDLAKRPYLLFLISEQLGALESLRASGQVVNAASLYEQFVARWLGRDEPKHTLDPMHKRLLMEEIAAALTAQGAREWAADTLEQWLDTFLHAHPEIASIYAARDRTLLKQDLRTATFVLRPDGGEKHFRFAHTSLQEYFLASHLARALREGRTGAWDLGDLVGLDGVREIGSAGVSDETLGFLGDILALGTAAEQRAARATLGTILGQAPVAAARLAFKYWLLAVAHNVPPAPGAWPEPEPAHVRLPGADLTGWEIHGHGPQRLLPLRGADFSGALFCDVFDPERSPYYPPITAHLRHLDLGGANLEGVQAAECVLEHVSLAGARLAGAHFRAAQWRHATLAAAHLGGETADAPPALLDGLFSHVVPPEGVAGPGPQEDPPAAGPTPAGRRPHSEGPAAGPWTAGSSLPLSARQLAASRAPQATRAPSGGAPAEHEAGGTPAAASCEPDSGSELHALHGGCAAEGPPDVSLAGGQPHESPPAPQAPANPLILQPSNPLLTTAARIHHVWLPATPAARAALRPAARATFAPDSLPGVTCCALSPLAPAAPDAAPRLVTGLSDGTLAVWNAATGARLLTFTGHSGTVCACAWSPDGRHLLSGSEDCTLAVWDAASGARLLTLTGHSSSVWACAWSPDGRHLLSGSDDKTLAVWDAITGARLLTLTGHSGYVRACAWSPDGRHLLSGSSDNTLAVWDAVTGARRLTLTGHSDAVRACTWSPDGRQILSGSDDHTLGVWDAATGARLLTLTGHSGDVNACTWSPDGRYLLAGSNDNTLAVWDAATGARLLTLTGHTDYVQACAWSPDGRHLLSCSSDKTLAVWDATTGARLGGLTGHSDHVLGCAWPAGGGAGAAGPGWIASSSHDGTVRVWRARDAAAERAGQFDCQLILAHGPDGEWAVLSGDAREIRAASPGAWRWLRWEVPAEIGREPVVLPAEVFGELPEAAEG